MTFFCIKSAVYKPGVWPVVILFCVSVMEVCGGGGETIFFQGLGFGIMFLRNDLGCFFSLWLIGGLGF